MVQKLVLAAFLGVVLCLIAFFVVATMTPSQPVARPAIVPAPTATAKEATKPKPAKPAPLEKKEAGARVYSDRLVQNTYNVAVDICFYDTREFLASDLGAKNDPDAIARKYSMGSREGPHRDAAYIGCLEGLYAPGAGRKQPYPR